MSGTDQHLMSAIVELTDTVVPDFDIKHFAGRIAAHGAGLPGVAAAGVLIIEPDGAMPGISAASTPEAQVLGEFQVQRNEGPAVDAYRTGKYVRRPDLRGPDPRWPRFSATARAAGFGAVHALPLRLRTDTMGALSLFSPEGGALRDDVVAAGWAIADAAGIGLAHRRRFDEQERLTVQLRNALDSRVVIEQAKGLLAERRRIDVGAAFDLLRAYARGHNAKIGEVAGRVVDGSLDPSSAPSRARRRTRSGTRS